MHSVTVEGWFTDHFLLLFIFYNVRFKWIACEYEIVPPYYENCCRKNSDDAIGKTHVYKWFSCSKNVIHQAITNPILDILQLENGQKCPESFCSYSWKLATYHWNNCTVIQPNFWHDNEPVHATLSATSFCLKITTLLSNTPYLFALVLC